jgi:hypothetical protein
MARWLHQALRFQRSLHFFNCKSAAHLNSLMTFLRFLYDKYHYLVWVASHIVASNHFNRRREQAQQ